MSKTLLTVFDGLYTTKVGARYPVNGGKDGKLLKDLRAIYSDEDIQRFMTAFFAMEDPFFAEAGWSLGCFKGCLPKVITYANRNMNRDPWHYQYCPHTPKCGDFASCRMLKRGLVF